MSFTHHFAQHIAYLESLYTDVLLKNGEFDAVLLHSGTERLYYGDDQAVPFRAYGHFNHWLPVNQPDQTVLFLPGEKPVYFQYIPRDFWYEQHITLEDWVEIQFDVHTLETRQALHQALLKKLGAAGCALSRVAFLGENTNFAATLGIEGRAQNPAMILHALDFHRARKTEYEIACIRKANRLALQGHTAARHAFENGGSEYAIHMAYLQACGVLDVETPYTNIVALDAKAAILHYQNKRRDSGANSQVLLIDAGCRINGYCSDITRTSTRPHTHKLFCDLVEAVEALQTGLIQNIRPGIPYPDIHVAAHEGLTRILLHSGLCMGSVESLLEQKMSSLFMPHGIGHLLGIQVHDVGGRMKNSAGDTQTPPAEYPALRTTRRLETDQVFTIEPGLYFIPLLLDAARSSERRKLINWELVDALTPLGGIRIEDNVRVTEHGVENLTRVLI